MAKFQRSKLTDYYQKRADWEKKHQPGDIIGSLNLKAFQDQNQFGKEPRDAKERRMHFFKEGLDHLVREKKDCRAAAISDLEIVLNKEVFQDMGLL